MYVCVIHIGKNEQMYVCKYVDWKGLWIYLRYVSFVWLGYLAAQHAEHSLVEIHDGQVDSAMRVHHAVVVHSHQYIFSKPSYTHIQYIIT